MSIFEDVGFDDVTRQAEIKEDLQSKILETKDSAFLETTFDDKFKPLTHATEGMTKDLYQIVDPLSFIQLQDRMVHIFKYHLWISQRI